jgi:flagellar hook-associated protein 2
MGRIQSNIGLITGVPIGDTVDKLMALAARPRDLLVARTDGLKQEEVAVTELTALLASVQYTAANLGKLDLFDQREATSSAPDVLSATLTGDVAKGSYQFTPMRLATSQQLLSSAFESDNEPLGGGTLSFRFGDHVRRAADLDLLGGGQGFAQGSIRITDRSGASAAIDLSTAQTIDDVLEAINDVVTIGVTASAEGDHIRLSDHTGQTAANLRVEEVGGGSTAATLGLAGVNVAADVADGQDVLWLADAVDLDWLNDGGGVHVDRVLDDISYQLRDGTFGTIDLSPIIPGGSEVDEETTLGEILDLINAAEPGKLQVEIAPDGERLILTDLTAGAASFTVQSLNDSAALAGLGLDGQAAGGVITGRRILGGLKTVLLSSLAGGQGLGELGGLELTDRGGATAIVNLSGAETLADVVDLINAEGIGITAQVNQAQNGIELVDTTGASAGNLIVANADATNTADKLGLAVDADVISINSGDLHLRVIAHNTRLTELNGGAGVARDRLTIYDTNGNHASLNLRDEDIQTVGDVIRQINRLGLGIRAELNETGDGIRIVDTAEGSAALRVVEGGSTTAADLHLLAGAVEKEIDGSTVQVIDGSSTYTVELDADDTLDDLQRKINELGAGVAATTLFDGSDRPYRLLLQGEQPGEAGALVFDTSGLGLSLQQTARARDALLAFGPAGSGVFISSPSNTFSDVISGLTLEIKQTSATPVTVTVDSTDTDFIASVTALVENYNRFRQRLDELTRYDSVTETAALLAGDATALRLDTDLPYFLSGRFDGVGSIRSLGELGIDLKDDGTLELDSSKLAAEYAESPEAVKTFFTDEEFGFSARLDALIERLSGVGGSLLTSRLAALAAKIEQNEEKIAFLNERLGTQRERMLLNFYRMELAVGRMQSDLSVLENLASLSRTSGNSSS